MRRFLITLLAVVAVLVAAMAINAYFVDRETEPAVATDGRLIELPGGSIQVDQTGARRKPDVVLIHGWTAAIDWWDRLTPLLTDRYHVVRVDLLGHGGSAKPRNGYAIEQQADRVAAALERLGVRTAMVAGHSTGGEVATALVRRHPQLARNLVVIDSAPTEDYVTIDALGKLSVAPLIGETIWSLAPDSAIRDGLKQAFANNNVPVPDAFVEDVRAMTFSSFDKTSSASADYVEDGKLERDIKAIESPEMIIFGAEDRLIETDRSVALYRQWLPRARTAIVPNAGHSPMWEQPGRTARLLTSFDRASR